MDHSENSDGMEMAGLTLEELKSLVMTGKLSVIRYYKEIDKRKMSHG